jgi:MFS transporter, DHA1 family, multidrug resistance protein
LTGAEVDLFVPSFPELQSLFGLTPFMVELTLGVNLAAHCLTSLFVGNLGDRYGRRPIILAGLVVFTIGSLFCVFAQDFTQLILGRFLQGVGISGPAVLSYLVIADAYSTEKQQQMMGALNGAVTLAMAFAPVAGSYVSMFFHWQGNFVVLLLMGLVCLVSTLFFVPKDQSNSEVYISIKEYGVVFKSPKAMYYILTLCMLVLGYWMFIGLSPILYMEDMGVSLAGFGFYQGSLAAMFSVVSFSSGYFLRKFGQRACFMFGMGALGMFIFLTFVLVALKINDPLIITLCMMLASLGVIFPINILYPLALEAVPHAKGRIAAVFVAGRLMMTAFGIQIVSYFYQGTFAPIGIAMCLGYMVMFWCCYRLFQQGVFFSKNTSIPTVIA